jgi:uncharacterized protein (TIGR02444 family)
VPPTLDSSPALWPFAVHAYALPGVGALCLRLQDEHGLEVDLLLAILWQACRGAAIDDTAIDRLLAAVAPVRPHVRELLALRSTIGSERVFEPRWQETYEHLKAAELAAERVELAVLETILAVEPSNSLPRPVFDPTGPPVIPTGSAGPALAALRRLAERCGASSCEPLLQALVDAVLPRPSAARG